MDIQSFIQSGLLEAYVMGQCTDPERAEVERMAAAHPEVRAELEARELALEKVALANAVPPPAGLRDQILERIQAEPPGMPAASAGRTFRLIPALGWAASILFGLALVGQFFSGRSEQERLQTRVTELEVQVKACETQRADKARLQQVVALLNDTTSRFIRLTDDPENPKATASVWHNPAKCEVAIDINSLPVPPAGKYYQFWSIVDGKPVSMEMVEYQASGGWQWMKCKGTAQAYAISEEDKPEGNPAPTVVVLVGPV